ncbi:MAG TPA: alpha/beta fold hydrolase [Solirubrobacteraceae bacterium]
MFERIHPSVPVNFQLNRWLELGGEQLLGDLRDAATRITGAAAYTHELLALAHARADAGDAKGAGALLIGAEFFMAPADEQRRVYREQGVALLMDAFAIAPAQCEEVPFRGGALPCVRVEAAGEPRGRILIHGGFDSYTVELLPWAMRVAQRGYTAVVFEGHGQGAALEDHGLKMDERWDECVAAVLDHHGLSDVALLGISLGGGLAIHAAAREPRVTRVICDDICADFQEVLLGLLPAELAPELQELLSTGESAAIDELIAARAPADPQLAWALARGCHVFGVSNPSALLAACAALRTREASAHVAADVLLLCAAADHYIPRSQLAEQAASLTSAASVSTVTLTAADHAEQHCHLGALELSIDVCLAWLADVDARRALRAPVFPSAPPT